MNLDKLKLAKKILIYGYGLEGQSSEKFLQEKTSSEILIFDENISELSENNDFENYDVIVVSSGVSRDRIPRNFQNKCTSNVEIFFENLNEELWKKIIGISGTKGKSTSTKFCAEFLSNAGFKAKIGGNYGIPLLDLFDDFFVGFTDYIVAELSSYQLENLKVSPHLSVFLNFFPDHLDRHLNLKNYFKAKENLWKNQKSGDFLIVPSVTEELLNKKSIHSLLVLADSLNADFFNDESIFKAKYWRENLGIIKSLSEILEIENADSILKKTAFNFKGLPHRMELFAEKEGIKFYDDSISTNPDSTLAGVNFFGNDLGCILLGGQDRKQDFTKLLYRLKELESFVVILPTESRENLLKTIEELGLTNFVDIKKWNGFGEIAKVVFEKKIEKKVCLLSCAAPSYDIFKNFIDRGDQWKKSVNKY